MDKPDIDGLDFLKVLREDMESDIPFIIFTGKGREEVAMEALNLGADRYLQKGGDARSQYDVLAQAIDQEVEHHRAKEQLKESKMLFESIFNDPDMYIGILDLDGRLLRANRNSLNFIGSSMDEVKGEPFWKTSWWDHSEELQERVKEGIEKAKDGERARFDAVHHGKNGRKVEVDFSIRPVGDEEGELKRLLAYGRDIRSL